MDRKHIKSKYSNSKATEEFEDLIENLNHGLMGRIIRQGTNYVIALTKEGMMFKSWIKDINEVHEVGTDSYRSYVQRMTPFEKVKSFTRINKNKKK